MLTTTANFTDQFQRADVEPVLIVHIWTGTTSLGSFCTGSRILTFPSIYNPFTGGTTPSKTVSPSVAFVTSLSLDIDPFERNISRGNITISFHDDSSIRDLIVANRIINQTVIVKLGTPDLVSDADWAPFFRGLIVDFEVREGMIDLVCKDPFHYTAKPYFGSWLNKHPLEVLKKVLEDQGVPAGLIDSDSFDITDASYSDIAHYVNTYWPSNYAPYVSMEQNHLTAARHRPQAAIELSIEQICAELCKAMLGSVYFQEDGVCKFIRFDTDATVRAHWGPDEIQEFKQLDSLIINELDIHIQSAIGQDRSGENMNVMESTLRLKDSTSQTNFVAPGDSAGVFAQSVDFELINTRGNLVGDVASSGGITARIYHPWGFCGSRVVGSFSSTWEALQTSGTNLSADRPLYFMMGSEVLKCVAGNLQEDSIQYPFEYDGDGDPTTRQMPIHFDLTVTSGNRAALSSAAAAHEYGDRAIDVTMAYDFGTAVLQRFSNGCPFVEVTTNLAQFAVQIGDFVTLENDVFLGFGQDGLTSAVQWEVVGKEVRLDDSNASIRWRLAYATQSSPPTVVKTYDWWLRLLKNGLHPEINEGTEREAGISRHVSDGMAVTISSGLVVTVNSGLCGKGLRVIPFQVAQNITVGANADHYLSFDTRIGAIAVQTVSSGAYAPEIGPDSVILAVAVAGGSTVTVTDLRNFGAVRPRNMSALDFEAGQNLIWNPGFETWSRGSSYPPDHWELGAGLTWLTNALRDSGDAQRGEYCLRLVTGSCIVTSSLFPVEHNRVYLLGGAVIPTATGITIQVGIQWYSTAGGLLSTEYVINASGFSNSAYTQKNAHVVAPATAAFAKIYLSRDNVSGEVLYDSLRLVRAMPSFFATNATQTIAKETTGTCSFTSEVHDHGAHYNAAAATFTAGFDGLYQFRAQILDVTNDDADSYICIFKNGSLFIQGTNTDDGHIVDSGIIALAAGDTIIPKFYNDYNGTATLTASATKCFFSGAQIH